MTDTALITLRERIEARAQYVQRRLQYASHLLLDQAAANQQRALTWQDIESAVDAWRGLISDDAERARATKALAEAYPLDRAKMPHTAALLQPDSAGVVARYQEQYGEALATAWQTSHPATEPAPQTIHDALWRKLRWRFLERGQTLIKRGEDGDGLYLLLDGLVDIEVADIDGDHLDDVVAQLHPGDFIGEIALLTGEPHSATVITRRDSDFAFLSNDAFNELVGQHPQLLRRIARQSVERLRAVYQPRRPNEQSHLFAILAASAGISSAIERLLAQAREAQRVALITPQSLHDVAASYQVASVEDFAGSYEFLQWLNRQKDAHDLIFCLGDEAHPTWTRRIIDQATRILIIGKADANPAISPQEAILQSLDQPHLTPPVELVLLHDQRDQQPQGTSAWLAERSVRRHHHIGIQHDADYQRLLRCLRGQAIGLVLGGGGMRGAAHAGVIQAMQDLGIHADFVGGTSVGAIIAAQYGLEWSVERIMAETKEKLLQRSTLFQFTFPYAALTSAEALNACYEAMFGEVIIEDLWIPTFTIASNLTQARMEVMDAGSLHLAVRASTSLAGIHPPTVAPNNDLLIDGGGFNNTPADVMRHKVGGGTVIAVDMGFTKRQFPDFNYGYSLNGFRWLLNRFNPLRSEKINAPFLMDTMMRSNALWSIQKTAEQIAHADLILKPPVSEFGLFDLNAADAIFQRGYAYALPTLRDWLDAP